MEFFDIVDQEGKPTGKTIERSIAHAEGIRHRTAHVWVVRKAQGRWQVLLQKRAMNKDSFPGCYDTSSAGHITAGDEPLESARRELQEELGIAAREEDLTFVRTFEIKFQQEFHGKMFKDEEVAFVFVYDKPVEIEKLVLQKEELDGVKWFFLEDVQNAIDSGDETCCVPPDGFQVIKNYLSQGFTNASSVLATAWQSALRLSTGRACDSAGGYISDGGLKPSTETDFSLLLRHSVLEEGATPSEVHNDSEN